MSGFAAASRSLLGGNIPFRSFTRSATIRASFERATPNGILIESIVSRVSILACAAEIRFPPSKEAPAWRGSREKTRESKENCAPLYLRRASDTGSTSEPFPVVLIWSSQAAGKRSSSMVAFGISTKDAPDTGFRVPGRISGFRNSKLTGNATGALYRPCGARGGKLQSFGNAN